ncbi:MAG: CBS domain-containing protein, partial [Chloroflexaceae bacterium]|nr:CBS domain-containing protein [Chloroflexaceae bacterium]
NPGGTLAAVRLLSQYHIRHLPVVDAQQRLVGEISRTSLRRTFNPATLLRLRRIDEVMSRHVQHMPPDTRLHELAQLMHQRQISCVVITTSDDDAAVVPVGIITERDIALAQLARLNLKQTPASAVMHAELITAYPEDSLWEAHVVMERHNIRHLVIISPQATLCGLITPNSLLQSFDPMEMYTVIDVLQRDVHQRTEELSRLATALQKEQLERQRAEEQTRAVERKLMESQKLESLGLLAGGIAHDFNNMLTSMLGHAELAQTEPGLSSAASGHLQALVRGIKQAADLTHQLLVFAGKSRQRLEAVQLNSVISEISELLRVSLPRRSRVLQQLASNLPPTQADPGQLHQIVLNLMTNAAEAIGDEGGTITLTTSVEWLDRPRLQQLLFGADLPAGNYVCLSVADTGCGMDEATLARIFDPFFTTKFTGRGLGLAAIHGIVRGHHGAMDVVSAPGQGTTFRVWFPAVLATPQPAPPPPRAVPFAQGTVLVIDDEEAVRHVVRLLLERDGFAVQLADNGERGLALLCESMPRVAAVLVDVTMPGTDGGMVAHSIRQEYPTLPLVVMSGYSAEEVQRIMPADARAAFLHKPFSRESLRRALETVIGIG